jgi:hypothetical protein
MRNLIGTLMLAIGALSSCASTSYSMQSDKELHQIVTHSNYIIIGEVVSIECNWNQEQTLIYTDVTISIKQTLKGNCPSNQMVASFLGGEVGSEAMIVRPQPRFQVGENVLVYLVNGPDQRKVVKYSWKGKLTIEDNKIKETGEDLTSYLNKISSALNTSEKEN